MCKICVHCCFDLSKCLPSGDFGVFVNTVHCTFIDQYASSITV